MDLFALARREFLAICEEAGSTIVHTSPVGTRTVKRVVQVVDTRETATYPRAVASEYRRPSVQDVLRRGDAVLYAVGDDAFCVGDVVTWRGRDWVVVGGLGADVLGEDKLYEEVGLRRLAATTTCRVTGTIARGN
ncbi:MAG: hypothetical protein LC624_08290 [Halobacteriales archaeon]|nr:hypothetical protein [Halobacteriales archaeon]